MSTESVGNTDQNKIIDLTKENGTGKGMSDYGEKGKDADT
jgi:hypothetical protein